MLLYECLAESNTNSRLNRALNESEQARLAKLCQGSSRTSALKSSLSERYLAFLGWQGTLRARLGPVFDF